MLSARLLTRAAVSATLARPSSAMILAEPVRMGRRSFATRMSGAAFWHTPAPRLRLVVTGGTFTRVAVGAPRQGWQAVVRCRGFSYASVLIWLVGTSRYS